MTHTVDLSIKSKRAVLHYGSEISIEFGGPNQTGDDDVLVFLVSCAILGGAHCVAWNYEFASVPEAWIWRVCSIIIGVLPFAMRILRDYEKFISLSYILYTLIRLYMIIEYFVGFRDTPAGLYQEVDWSIYIPHFA